MKGHFLSQNDGTTFVEDAGWTGRSEFDPMLVWASTQ